MMVDTTARSCYARAHIVRAGETILNWKKSALFGYFAISESESVTKRQIRLFFRYGSR
jgi:hypothetical protein